MSTTITKDGYGCSPIGLVIVLMIGSLIFFVPKAIAGWGRLQDTNEEISVGGATVHIVYDKLEHVNCYVSTGSNSHSMIEVNNPTNVSIYCMKAEK